MASLQASSQARQINRNRFFLELVSLSLLAVQAVSIRSGCPQGGAVFPGAPRSPEGRLGVLRAPTRNS